MTNLVASRPTTGGGAPPPPAASRGLRIALPLGLLALIVVGVATGRGVYVLGFLGFVLALLVSVTLHEGGHFLMARRYGMKSTQFFVGFGKTLWSRQRGETEYGVKAIPAGGFVKIVGMTQLEEVDPADEPRAFWRQPAGQRAVVLAAGSTVHFIIAVVLVLLSSLAIGKSVELAPAVGAVSPCVTAAASGSCGDGGSLPSPAQAAGLQVGDIVESVDGTPITGYLQLIRELRSHPAEAVPVQVLRGEQTLALTITPAAVARAALPGPDGASTGTTERVGAIGVQPQFRSGTERLGPVAAVTNSVETGKLMVTGIVDTFSEKIGTITKVYGPDRDPAGFIGVVGAGRISGEVIASEETISTKILSFILLIAGLNLFVGVFNLLPLLPLDGGHLAVLGFEQARDKIKRTFGYAGPLRRVDLTKLLPVTYAVVVFFAGFTVWLLGADIVNPIRLTQ